MELTEGYCGKCLKQVVIGRPRINHLPNLILTLLTGFWIIFWIRDARKEYEWKCAECGEVVYRTMSNVGKEQS